MRKKLIKITALSLCFGILLLSAPTFAVKAEKPKIDMKTLVQKSFFSLLKLLPWMNPVIQPDIWKNDGAMWKTTGGLSIDRLGDGD